MSVNAWIVPDGDRFPAADQYSPGQTSRGTQLVQPVEACVWHWTAGPHESTGWLTRRDSVFVSVHFSVSRNGRIKQMIPLTHRGAHAGGRSSRLFGKQAVNARTVGVEVENLGKLVRNGGEWGYTTTRGWYPIPEGRRIVRLDGNAYEAFTDRQKDAIVRLARMLAIALPVLADPTRHVGHNEVDPTRKIDPGPLFPWSELRRHLVYAAADPVPLLPVAVLS